MRLPSAADRATATAILLQGVAAIALLGLAFNSDKVIALVANSDALLPAALIFDIRHHPEVWMTFQFPRVPSLVPDLLIYGAVQLATDSWRAAAFAYAVVASLAMTAAAGLIAARLAGVRPMPAAGAFLTLAMLLLGLEWWTDAPPMLWYIVVPVFHGGPFVMALGGLLLALGLFECRGRAGGLLLLTAVSACGALSDKMFVGELTLPLLGALGWLARRGQLGRRRVSVIAGAVLAGTALGVAADHVIFSTVLARQPDVPLEWDVFVSRAASFLHGPYLGLILGSNALVLTAPLVLRRLRRTEPDDGRVLRFFAVAAAATVVPTTLLAT